MEGLMEVWNVLLTLSIGVAAYFLKEKAGEVQRIQILINKTREEMAKEYVTKVEARNDTNRILDRLETLDAKLDRLMERK